MSVRTSGRGIAMVALAVVSVALAALADVEIDVLSSEKEISPGQFVTHVFAITHTGAAAETYALTVNLPAGWAALGVPSSIALDPGEEETLFVTITVPAGAVGGAYSATVRAQSTSDPTVYATATLVIGIGLVNEVEIVPPIGEAVPPGGEWIYEFLITNHGNVQDVLSLSADSSRGLPVDVAPATVELAPQETRSVSVRLIVPATENSGRDVLSLRAVSTLYAGVEDEAILFTTILPPSPQAVGGSLVESLAGRLRVSIEQSETSGDFSSRLSFSSSGRVLGGYLAASFSALSPFGPDALDVSSYSIQYRRTPATYALGTVSQSLTDLLATSCEGGAVTLDTDFADVSMIAGFDDAEGRFAGHVTVGPEAANLGIGYSDARSEMEQRSIWTATAAAEPLDHWTLRAEGAVGTDNGLLGQALFFNTTLNASSYFLTANVFSVDTYFPGLRSDSAGLELSQRLRLPALSLGLSLAHVWNNVVRDPLLDTLMRDSLGFNLYALPIEDGPALRSTLEFEWSRTDHVSVRDDVDLLLACSLSQSSGTFPFELDGKIVDQIDRAAGSHVRTTTYGQGVGLSFDAFYLFLRLEEETYIDVVNDVTLSAASNVSLTLRPEGTVHEATLTLRNEVDDFDLDSSIFVRLSNDLDLVFDGSITWDRADATAVSFEWGISARVSFALPIPFLVTKGRIAGRLYIDRNGNGLYDGADEPVGNAVLAADGREVSTDSTGNFRFPPLVAGTYKVRVTRLPVEAAPSQPVEITLAAGDRVTIDVPLVPVVVVRGTVFNDANRDGIRQDDEGGWESIQVVLRGASGTTLGTSTDERGDFAFVDLVPGVYTVSLDARSLPARFVFTTPETQDVTASLAATPFAEWGGYVPPREVVITYQPPTADFVFDPEEPTAGAPITFDGSYSFDFDGTVVAYEWDFDGDGIVDATGETAVHVFEAPGTYDVRLTITDDAENTDTVAYPIEIREGGVPITVPGRGSFQPPIADFAYSPVSPIAGAPVAFDGSASIDFDGTVASYTWDFNGDGRADATGPRAAYTFSEAGEHVVSLTVVDDGGSRDTASIAIAVGPSPSTPVANQPPRADFSFAPAEPPAGETIRFDGTSSVDPDGSIVAYSWDFDADGAPDASGPGAEHAFTRSGTFDVTLDVVDDAGARGTTTRAVGVAPAPAQSTVPSSSTSQPPIADFQYLPLFPELGEPVMFNGTASIDLDGTIVDYAWDFDADGETDSNDPITVYVFPTSGTFDVRLTVTDETGSSDSVILTLKVG